MRRTLGLLLAVAGCGGAQTASSLPEPAPAPTETATDHRIANLTPHKLATSDASRELDAKLESYFQRTATKRAYIATDKPLYQPGETIWFRADVRSTGTLIGTGSFGATVHLVSPRGATAMSRRVLITNGVGANDFALPADLDGGEYTLDLLADDGTRDSRKIVVNTYEPPRLKKSIEMLRKAYGEGDTVAAAIEVHRATGEAFANRALTGVVTIDGHEVARVPITTDRDGKAIAKFDLPARLTSDDALLTLMVDDGGITESMQKRIPIVQKTLGFEMFPEGGDLVDGIPGRVYFAAKTTLGKPADVEGKVVDDRGHVVAELGSIHDGMGRFELEPAADRSYHVEITKPAGITAQFAVPAAKDGGCALRAVDDSGAPTTGGATADDAMRVAAICTTARTLEVEATLREQKLASGAVEVAAHEPTLIELPVAAGAQGAVRVTLLSSKHEPLAERLVYHGLGADMKVTLTADKKTYTPREPVKLHVHAEDAAGKPVQANLAVAVVDDTVLSFADDKGGRMLARMFLEHELGTPPDGPDSISEPNFYFMNKPDSRAALDALLATRGYRRFEWRPVFDPPPPVVTATAVPADAGEDLGGKDLERGPVQRGVGMQARAPVAVAPPPPAPQHAPAAVAARPIVPAGKAAVAENLPVHAMNGELQRDAHREDDQRMRGGAVAQGIALDKKELAGDDNRRGGEFGAAFAPVRVFPVPQYAPGYDGPRTDFRETIYWNPTVITSADGNADVSFAASDAITSFRATAEGVSNGGLVGGGDAVVQSKMPVSLDAHLPTEVTSGDVVQLPVTLTNETDRDLDADLRAKFGAAFQLAAAMPEHVHLKAGEKQTMIYGLRVVATEGSANVDLALATAGLTDELHKDIRVVPLGFPFEISASGTASASAPGRHDFDLAGALPGSVHAKVTMYPSPLASMTQGMEAMIREPGGCFEQTSSSNYPNIMILSYLGAHDAASPALVASAEQKLDHGYKLLTGYETPDKGYEWFGHTPGHEALTAYGLMEFADMANVYDVDPKMIERTASWLMAQRDGKGGFKRSKEALDSFGRASESTTTAYIMWALSEAKRSKAMEPELAVQRALGETTSDPYLLALATNTALLTAPQDGETSAMVKRLVGLQAKDGSFAGARETITMSGGESLVVETTALATLALIKASPNREYESQLRGAVEWLNGKRSGYGQWNNTQATILGLKALTAYADHARAMQVDGSATLVVNGKEVGIIAFDKGSKEALVWDDVASALVPGKNSVEVRIAGGASLPYSIAVDYRAAQPQSSERAKVAVATELDKTQLKMGEGAVLHAHVENRTDGGLPMTLARIGIPGGMVFQTWQLKELREQGVIDFYETRPREVVLYWRALAPGAKKDIAIDLLASVPGAYVAPASSAYLYYTAEDKAWSAPVKVAVDK